jgi:hypothetical protein
MTVNDAYWEHVTGTTDCNKSCREAWQRTPPRRATTDELLGIDPDWCGGLSVDEFVRQQRTR